MFIALIQTAFGGLCSTLALAGCVSTTLDTTGAHPAHAHAGHHHPAPTREALLSGSDDATSPEQAPAASWTCPMHPEVVRDEPGKCPTCGMKLVEKKESPPPSGDEK